MKAHSILSVLLVSFFLALIITTFSLRSVQAQTCYNQQQQPVPCPNSKPNYKNPTKPAPSATPTATSTPPVSANCTQNPLTSSVSIPNAGAGSSSGSPFSSFEFGAAGLVVGILIGLFVPSLIGAPGGIMRGVPPPRSTGKVPTTGADEDRPGGGC